LKSELQGVLHTAREGQQAAENRHAAELANEATEAESLRRRSLYEGEDELMNGLGE
jgi:hypothetical protein